MRELAGRLHAYGDVYSNPGLSLQQKQLITSAFLVSDRNHTESHQQSPRHSQQFITLDICGLKKDLSSSVTVSSFDMAPQPLGQEAMHVCLQTVASAAPFVAFLFKHVLVED